MPETYGVDVAPATQEEALTFMLHHLGLAASYFEAIREDAREGFEWRVAKERAHKYGPGPDAAEAWFNVMEAWYKEQADD